MQIAGVTLSQANAEKIALKALEVAEQEGHCDEAERMLELMGFPIPSMKRTVTLTIEVEGRGDLTDRYVWNISTDYDQDLSITDISVVSK